MQNNNLSPNKDRGIWQYQEAKAKLSKVMDNVQTEGMQIIIRNRTETYYVLSKEKYDEYTKPKISMLEFFLNAPCPELELDIIRNSALPRDVDL